MRFIKEQLAANREYPCTIRELKTYLAMLPPADVKGITSVKLMDGRRYGYQDGEIIDRHKIILVCTVDSDNVRIFKTKSFPGEYYTALWREFSGQFGWNASLRWVRWQSRDHLKRYMRFVLFHEVGHKAFWDAHGYRGKQTGAESQAEEEFCDQYARKYLDRCVQPSHAPGRSRQR